tara:strand:+ start:428 stop:667 length:240 start_codon:yes stop_codon:yes gene_type:complete
MQSTTTAIIVHLVIHLKVNNLDKPYKYQTNFNFTSFIYQQSDVVVEELKLVKLQRPFINLVGFDAEKRILIVSSMHRLH